MAAEEDARSTLLVMRVDERVTPIELFFDLVYVFALGQLSHLLLGNLTGGGAIQTAILLTAVWCAWIHTTWATNFFDPNTPAMRLVILAIMLVSLLMSAAIPDAFGDRAWLFAGAYLTMQLGRTIFIFVGLDRDHQLRRHYRHTLFWFGSSGVLWIAGAAAHGGAREALWAAAIIVEYLLPLTGIFGPLETDRWTINGGHMAERCHLFLIVALGEQILTTGATYTSAPSSPATTTALVVAFLTSVALWWTYFDHSADFGRRVLTRSSEPGRLAYEAYHFFHLPIVAGIVVLAVADELSIAHPGHAGSGAYAAVALGGPALFIAGWTLYLWAVSGAMFRFPLVAIAALAVLTPVALTAERLPTAIAVAVVIVALAAWKTRMAPRWDAEHPETA